MVRNFMGKVFAGKIIEVEAYGGSIDQAAHTYGGRTIRNEIMFREGGYLYVYFTYGMHFCCNVVSGKENEGNAVLLRGVEPVEGIKYMALNRFQKDSISRKEKLNLTSGPAKICEAFGIKREENGTDLTGNNIFIAEFESVKAPQIVTTRRIGIKKSKELPWRFYLIDNPYVSVN